ncbi:MAG: hypothetical protein KDN19_09905 [Verrucomicrobiae bacterium]|nr:hypothetical protein [Verrucomicrobiae bacterium]
MYRVFCKDSWWISPLAIALLSTLQVVAQDVPPISQPIAVPQKFWLSEFNRQRHELAKGGHQVCFFGDSLTAFWTEQGVGSWELDLKEFRPLNSGIAGDRVENIHFRVRESTFPSPPPKALVVLAGTNNLGKQPPDDSDAVADGVLALVKTLQLKAPKSEILVLSILPSGVEPDSALRRNIRRTNARLATDVPKTGAAWLDFYDRFVDDDGHWLPGLTVDGTHLTSRGYDRLAAPVKAWLEAKLGKLVE